MIKLAVIHFSPLELYPPVQNFLDELAREDPDAEVLVLTTARALRLSVFQVDSEKMRIVRLGRSEQKASAIKRYWNYFVFYLFAFIQLLRHRPTRILYFETLSSFPAYMYKRFVNRSIDVLIHYHEYTSKEEYARGRKLPKYFHKLEQWLYPKAAWVSHTNELRLHKFRCDLQPFDLKNAFALPNYPPKSWYTVPKQELSFPLRIVYVGSLGLDTMYVREFSEWVVSHNGNVLWDIYSFHYSSDTLDYFRKLDCKWINPKDGLDYKCLPEILRQYDVGVVLYNGHIPNYVYNAPNKLFEYLAAGLAVWFPIVMEGALPYCTSGTYPEVLSLDFARLSKIKVDELICRKGFALKRSNLFCEEAVKPLLNKALEVK